MLTITVKFNLFGLGTAATEDLCSALGYLGQVTRRGMNVLLKYDHTNHEAVRDLVDHWARTTTLEEVEADFGHGVSTLKDALCGPDQEEDASTREYIAKL